MSRERLLKIGVKPMDIKRIANPYDFPFEFEAAHKTIDISPIQDCLPEAAYIKLILFTKVDYQVEPHTCHKTARVIANFLCRIGVETFVVDGFVEVKEKGLSYAHTFCKVGDSYFDPTIEFTRGFEGTNMLNYYSERVFNAYEYFVLQLAMGYAYTSEVSGYVSTSTLIYYYNDRQETEMDYVLNNDGYIVSRTMDEIFNYYNNSPVELCSVSDDLSLYAYTTKVGYE